MSFSRLRESRGYSIVASLVVVAILILVVVAIQATLPPLPSQQSMSAAAASGSGGVGSDAVVQQQTDEKKKLAQLCQNAVAECQKNSGSCSLVREKKSATATGDINDDCVGAVQDGTVKVGNTMQPKYRCTGRTAKVTFLTDLAGGPGSYDIQSYPDGSVAPGVCKTLICQPQMGSSPIVSAISVTQLKCGTANANGLNQNSLSGLLSGSNAFTMTRSLGDNSFVPSGPLSGNQQSIIDSVYGNSSGSSGQIPAGSGGLPATPAADQIANLSQSSPADTNTQQAQQQITAMGCQNGNNPALCGDNSALTPGYQGACPNGSSVDVSTGICSPVNQPQGPCPNGGAVNSNGTCSTNQPNNNNGNTFNQGPGNQPTNQPSPSNSGNGAGNWLSNLFGGGNNNPANNQPQSPFGGACNTRYVCSGNTLYYQAQSGGIYTGSSIVGQQCQTMPVQQCPYGCMAMTATNGTNSTLNDVGTGLQIASVLLRAFGGGGSNNTMANPNLSSQCAMTPQQAQGYQSPYGTGTNGQPCYQPPQQPDPSQCTAGTWKPTSSSGNGCTTGWQCVPNGSTNGTGGTGGGTPTAQLSCQPKIADIGTPISFSYACGNATASKGTGFETGGAVSGTTAVPAPTPPSGTNQVSFALTCTNQGVTASAQCQVQLNKAGIVMITNPRTVASGESSLIGWVTAGMQSCVVSSPDDQNFTARNAGNTSPSGAATTSPMTHAMNFRLDCTTLAGGTKTATTTVSVTTN